jgi:hypothetical protein
VPGMWWAGMNVFCIFCHERPAITRGACHRCYKRALEHPELKRQLAPTTQAKRSPRTVRHNHGLLEYIAPVPQMRRCAGCGVRAANPSSEDPNLCWRCDGLQRWGA